ncbi:excinuclease ABC subunit UvrC [Corynebacterium sp. 13CS0277]|uniref:excinuclease ABC subunit UvrC n=1 Tax=Corynebacterium sp. 13CS0277 TaxID=2071994 RepID=UPI000D027235|nr:excinuclease ABC subunit UvrC [Corynebacterium sp. 13CS0277]PRQ11927.1 excinuclease ABC subunit UvrC [Corynebacterium sp. 13CS0277]
MADPTTYRPAPGTIPTEPGVYKFRDSDGRVIYVGKAKNLAARLSNYFQDLTQLHPRTRTMVTTAASVEWTVVASEVEALQLEYTWIKSFDPRFNVKYRDDKTYPMLAVSTGERVPRAFVYRGPRRSGVRYFGPYSHAWAIRETLDLLLRVFPVRTCANGVFRRHERLERPCLLGYIDKCAAPCVKRVSSAEYADIVSGFISFMSGKTDPVVRELEREMHAAAEDLDFERAARLRDDVGAVRRAMEQQAVVLGDGTDADVIACAVDDLEASVQVFHVRGGRIRGQRGWVVEKPDVAALDAAAAAAPAATGEEPGAEPAAAASEAPAAEAGAALPAALRAISDASGGDPAVPQLLQDFMVQFYGDAVERAEAEREQDAHLQLQATGARTDLEAEEIHRRGVDQASHTVEEEYSAIPRQVLVQVMPANAEQVGDYLAGLRGSRVELRIPQRGEKRALMQTVERNALEALKQHKLKRVGDMNARSAALAEIQEALGMAQAPLRIECTDISHIQGTDVVASLVVFEDGLPKKSDYRRYKITVAGEGRSDDVASIREVTERRFLRHRTDADHPGPAAGQGAVKGPEGEWITPPAEEEFDGSTFADESDHLTVEEQSVTGKKFAYPPQLFIVDGGLPQVNAAAEVFDSLGIHDVTLIGLAKRLEEVWLPGEEDPLILPRNSAGLFLLQHIRDEAHRFAITFHRQQRSKRMRSSELDRVKGLGPARRTALVKHFGSVAKLKQASVDDIQQVKGFGAQLAADVYAALHPEG